MKRGVAILLPWLLLSGCQTTHTLKEPTVDYTERLPAIHVTVSGAIPASVFNNDLRRRGTFEQVINGQSPDGYNLLVLANSDYYGMHNVPLSLLSALTFFTVPAAVTWDSQVIFKLTQGERNLGVYYVSNHTESWRGIVEPFGGQPEHVQLIADAFIALVVKDQPFRNNPVGATQ